MTMANEAMSSPQRTGASLRKTNKPLMEKRRRARINDSLSQLKSLVIQSSKKDSSQFNKLEKADILELTVKYLRNLQDQQQQKLVQANSQASLAGKYQAGFMECANEVMRYLGQSHGFSDDVKSRVVQHLASCIQLSNKVSSLGKPVQSGNTLPAGSLPFGFSPASSPPQHPNGQVIHIKKEAFQNGKSASSLPNIQPASISQPAQSTGATTHIPVVITSITPNTTSLSQQSAYVRYTQPLQIQIPTVVSPVLIQPKPSQPHNLKPSLPTTKTPEMLPKMTPQALEQHNLVSISPLLQSKDTSLSPLPIKTCQKPQKLYSPEDQYSDFMFRSRTYSFTSSSSDSELSSPLNLSQSPHFYDSLEVNNGGLVKYPSPSGNQFYSQVHLQSEKVSSTCQSTLRDRLFLSHCPSNNFTSVIVDGRKNIDNSQSARFLHYNDDERAFIRQEDSTSPASSVGDERLWRPW